MCLMVLLVVMKVCFLWKYALITREGCVAVIVIVCPSQNADFFQEVVRDGLAMDDGDHRDATVHQDMGFSIPCHDIRVTSGECGVRGIGQVATTPRRLC